jgi:diguanylate cyclase (GGDEF)-like protein/PAS domain S-box-containing protein
MRNLVQPVLRIGLPIALVFAALLLHLELTAHFGLVLPAFLLFYPAVISAALFFGLWPGLLATSLSAVLASIWIFPPSGPFRTWNPSSAVALALFSVIGAFISMMLERHRRTVQRKADLEHKHARQAGEERYRLVFQTSIDAIVISRLHDGTFLDVNSSFRSILGYEPYEALGKTSLDLELWADVRDRERLAGILRLQSNCQDFQARLKRKGGKLFWGTISASLVEIDGESCILSVLRDITQARLAQEEIRNLAFFDPLTGLANRRLLLEQLRKSMAFSARRHLKRALFFVDLDDFRKLNNALGHQAGDLLLRKIAQRLTACVREVDTVGRLGGDEFVLLVEDLSANPEEAADEARAIAEKILRTVREPYQLDGRECNSSCSIGITIFGDGHENIGQILQQADIAMCRAKAAGPNALHFFAPALQTAVNARATMEEDLRRGIKAKQFLLFYQPQMEDGQVIGVEALLRWNHPRLGLLPPGDFIPLAEETHLILPLGKWVLESACKRIAAWGNNPQTASLSVAVNISAVQFCKPDFVDAVMRVVERTGANPCNLSLELTESILVDNVEDVILKMVALKSFGVRFSLDDFGTGYSSLTYLKRLPLDQLKIDRSFVCDILGDASSAAIAQSIISLSRAMGLPVIAEGVETEGQRAILADLGCHSFQGFLCSRPVPLDEFELLLPNLAASAAFAAV